MKVPLYEIGSWDILGKYSNPKIIRLVPDIPRICVQIKLEVHQIDPVKKQGWNLGETCSYHRNQVNRMMIDPASSHVPQREVPAPLLETDSRAGLLWCCTYSRMGTRVAPKTKGSAEMESEGPPGGYRWKEEGFRGSEAVGNALSIWKGIWIEFPVFAQQRFFHTCIMCQSVNQVEVLPVWSLHFNGGRKMDRTDWWTGSQMWRNVMLYSCKRCRELLGGVKEQSDPGPVPLILPLLS